MTESRRRAYARRVVSRRGAALLVFSAVFVLLGSTLLVPTVPDRPIPPVYRHLFALLPPTGWGLVFVGAGLFAALHGLTRRIESPFAFASLASVAAAWGAGLLAGAVTDRNLGAAVGSLLWVAIVGLVIVVAGWPNPPRSRPPEALPWEPPPEVTP